MGMCRNRAMAMATELRARWLSRIVPAMSARSSSSSSSSNSNSKSYSTAVAMALDDDDDEEQEEYMLPWNLAKAQAASESGDRGVRWVFFGNPGIDKSAFASKVSKLLDVPHICMGSLVRQHLAHQSQLSTYVREGKLLPDSVIFNLLFSRLELATTCGDNGFVLDGFPRTRFQAEILDYVADIDLAINLKSREEFPKRMYLGGRVQNHEILKEKLRFYREQNKDLEDYYQKQRKLLNFEVPGDIQESWPGLLAALDLKDVDPSSPQITA